MPTMSPEQLQKINDLRRRILNKEQVTAEELNQAIVLVREARGARTAAVNAEARAKKVKEPKAPVPTTMEDLNKLWASLGKKL